MATEYKVVDDRDGELVDVFDDEAQAVITAETSGWFSIEERHYNGVEENSAEDDDDTTNMNYDFITATDDVQDETNDFDTVGSMWTLGDHSALETENKQTLMDSIDGVMGDIDSEIDDDVMGVLQDARDVVGDTSVSRFECPVEACGLGHSHSDHKHDIRSGFNVTAGFADQMSFCPYCHCGVNELSMLMDFYAYIDGPVFEDSEKLNGVSEIDPEVLRKIHRVYTEEDARTVRTSVRRVAENYNVPPTSIAPMDIRDDLRRFFNRRSNIREAADSAPIAQETRTKIFDLQIAIEEALSE